jgi:hypothetical protein
MSRKPLNDIGQGQLRLAVAEVEPESGPANGLREPLCRSQVRKMEKLRRLPVVVLRRPNRLAQAVSCATAQQTGSGTRATFADRNGPRDTTLTSSLGCS